MAVHYECLSNPNNGPLWGAFLEKRNVPFRCEKVIFHYHYLIYISGLQSRCAAATWISKYLVYGAYNNKQGTHTS